MKLNLLSLTMIIMIMNRISSEESVETVQADSGVEREPVISEDDIVSTMPDPAKVILLFLIFCNLVNIVK